jgi:hypothetical protein
VACGCWLDDDDGHVQDLKREGQYNVFKHKVMRGTREKKAGAQRPGTPSCAETFLATDEMLTPSFPIRQNTIEYDAISMPSGTKITAGAVPLSLCQITDACVLVVVVVACCQHIDK